MENLQGSTNSLICLCLVLRKDFGHRGFSLPYVIWFILSFMLPALSAQTNNSDTLNWEDKRLEWSDFHGIPVDYSPLHSELHSTIGYSRQTCFIEDSRVTTLISYCTMNRSTSWAKAGSRDDKYLIYNQMQFDLGELYSRKLQNQLFLLLNEKKDRQLQSFGLLLDINLECQQRIDQLTEQTNYGNDGEAVKSWAEVIAKELEQTPRQKVPEFKNKKFAVGGSFDLGGGIMTPELNEYFTNNFNLSYGFDIGYRSLIFNLRATLGFNSVRKDFEYKNKLWPEKLSTGLASGDLTMGYPLLDTKKSRITPFAGISYLEFSVLGDQKKYENQLMGNFAYCLGLNYDYKTSTTINFMSTSNEKTDWFIRTRLYISVVTFNDQFKGASINFTVGFGGWVRFLKIVPPAEN
jgi:hypothetical protein